MTIAKPDAEREAIRRWYGLPANLRQTYEDAEIFASRLDLELDFYTVTSKQRLIEAWLIRELHRAASAPQLAEVEAVAEAANEVAVGTEIAIATPVAIDAEPALADPAPQAEAA